jgi:hypothetical protein
MPGMLFSLFMPFGSTMRVFHRFALDSSLGFAILAGLGAASLWSATRANRQTLLAAGLIIVALVDVAAAPLPFGVSDASGFEVDHWLSEQQGDFSVIHLPLARGLNGPGLYRAAIHGKKISYGYGTFYPNAWRVAVTPLGNFPNPEAIALLRSWHVRYVLLGQGAYEAVRVDAPGDSWDKVQERLKSTPELRYVRTFDEEMPAIGDKLSDKLTVPWLGVPVIADRTLVYEVLP